MAFKMKGSKTNNRRFPGVKGVRPDHKKQKQVEAEERQLAWSKLSPKQKLLELDRRGVRATKQRKILEALLEK
jgi:hypothetical protein